MKESQKIMTEASSWTNYNWNRPRYYVQPTSWGELDSDWSEMCSSIEESIERSQTRSQEENEPMSVWTLDERTGRPVQIQSVG